MIVNIEEWLAKHKYKSGAEYAAKGTTMGNYYKLWRQELDRSGDNEKKYKAQLKRNKMLGRYLMAHSRRLRATGDDDSVREANSLVAMLKGYYDEYKFTDVQPLRWVTQDNVDRNPEYYKVLKTVNGLLKSGEIVTWCLIVPAKEYPRCPAEVGDDPSV